jgi:hypothetical protein
VAFGQARLRIGLSPEQHQALRSSPFFDELLHRSNDVHAIEPFVNAVKTTFDLIESFTHVFADAFEDSVYRRWSSTPLRFRRKHSRSRLFRRRRRRSAIGRPLIRALRSNLIPVGWRFSSMQSTRASFMALLHQDIRRAGQGGRRYIVPT